MLALEITFAGHAAPVPEQTSATSQPPAAARQTVPSWKSSTGQAISKQELARRYRTLRATNPLVPDLTRPISNRWDLSVQVNDVQELTDDFAPTDALLLDASPS